MSSCDQARPDDGSGFEYALMIGAVIVLSFLMYVLIAVVALVSVTACLLALPFFLLDERRHQQSMGHPLWDSDLDLAPESGVGDKAGPIGRVRPADPARRH